VPRGRQSNSLAVDIKEEEEEEEEALETVGGEEGKEGQEGGSFHCPSPPQLLFLCLCQSLLPQSQK